MPNDKHEPSPPGIIDYLASILAPNTLMDKSEKIALVLGFALLPLFPWLSAGIGIYLMTKAINPHGLIMLFLGLLWMGTISAISWTMIRILLFSV